MCVRMRLSVHMLVPMCTLTFVVGGVVDAEISIPDDSQLHGKTAHLHPIIEILSPWQPEGESPGRAYEREREKLLSYFKLSIISKSKRLWYHSTLLNAKCIINRWL